VSQLPPSEHVDLFVSTLLPILLLAFGGAVLIVLFIGLVSWAAAGRQGKYWPYISRPKSIVVGILAFVFLCFAMLLGIYLIALSAI
jgi:hypothetical protein